MKFGVGTPAGLLAGCLGVACCAFAERNPATGKIGGSAQALDSCNGNGSVRFADRWAADRQITAIINQNALRFLISAGYRAGLEAMSMDRPRDYRQYRQVGQDVLDHLAHAFPTVTYLEALNDHGIADKSRCCGAVNIGELSSYSNIAH